MSRARLEYLESEVVVVSVFLAVVVLDLLVDLAAGTTGKFAPVDPFGMPPTLNTGFAVLVPKGLDAKANLGESLGALLKLKVGFAALVPEEFVVNDA